jgi:hydrogenase nickel incorporation protein HypA/HybF
MHELAITQSILDIVLEYARREAAPSIGSINLVIGEMTGVAEEYVRLYLGLIGRGTEAENAQVHVRLVPITLRCRQCGERFKAGRSKWACPSCQSTDAEITGGRELFVESIEVEDGSQST